MIEDSVEASRSAAVNTFVSETRMRDGECIGYESQLLGIARAYAAEADKFERELKGAWSTYEHLEAENSRLANLLAQAQGDLEREAEAG